MSQPNTLATYTPPTPADLYAALRQRAKERAAAEQPPLPPYTPPTAAQLLESLKRRP